MDTHYSYVQFYARRARRRSWLAATRDAAVLALAAIVGWVWLLTFAMGGAP